MSTPKSPINRHGLGGGMAARQTEAPTVDLTRERQDRELLTRIVALRLDGPTWDANPGPLLSCADDAMRWWWQRGDLDHPSARLAYVDYVNNGGCVRARVWLREVVAMLRGAR